MSKYKKMDEEDFDIIGEIYGNVSNANTLYGEAKLNGARGHGFAAERANHLNDLLHGRNAILKGDDFVKNGADRIVDGVNIQSKYCNSGSKCISECFENGRFRYVNPNGGPMQIEVPSDKYDDAVKAMKERIRRGQIPGVSNPEKAKDIVRKGAFTYEQAKNIAKAGTIESLAYDATNGIIVGATTFGISATINFAVSIWNGESFDIALEKATFTGLRIGGTAFASAILVGQLEKAGMHTVLMETSQNIVKLIGPKASATLVNIFRESGTNIYGAAAMNNAAKLFRANVITNVAAVVVTTAPDIINIFRGRISGKQLFKNIVKNGASVGGGAAGFAAGAAMGSVVPGIGTFVGGLVGAFVGGTIGNKAVSKATSFIEDDAVEMIRIIEDNFKDLAIDYLLNKKEVENIVASLSQKLSGNMLKDMFASDNKNLFAKNLLKPIIEFEVRKRKKIYLPTSEQKVRSLKMVLEKL